MLRLLIGVTSSTNLFITTENKTNKKNQSVHQLIRLMGPNLFLSTEIPQTFFLLSRTAEQIIHGHFLLSIKVNRDKS